ncbi:ribosome biogenesis GTPase Der [Patescibacteria group bacterium]|nr:ribosome biogenesis GTPase Der [Patescibacteria group bacterium]MBU1448670.1 ribosome biogenesis GTPase Der [Patescibacteria group bacterium]MBU2612918.1 ribosome biogenesis GTPase Der [Patescibacteria group bacterium]
MTYARLKQFPIVAIVGRANVGKSTLWNRLTETTRAIVSPIAHTTRDRNYGLCLWRGAGCEVVDTGGMDAEQGSQIGRGILRQAEIAIKEADLVLFLIDGEGGVMPQDRDLARHAKQLNKRILLIANKIDNPRASGLASTADVFDLGLGEGLPISAGTGRGVGDLLDVVIDELEKAGKPPQPIETHEGLRLVIMGRPNVGKSSLMNAILGEERVIVSPVAHTTREPQDTTFKYREEHVTLVDTAGMRKRSRITKGVEAAGIERNRQVLTSADVAFLVFDATEDPRTQDKRLAGLLEDAGRGLILVANKWDLVPDKNVMTAKKFEASIRETFPFLSWAPVVFISAKERQRTDKLLDMAFRIREERRRRISHNALQRFLKTIVARKKPVQSAGPSSPYVHEATQIGIEPPSFLITVRGDKVSVHISWLRYFENRLREKFGFEGTPVYVKARNVKYIPKPEPTKVPGEPKKVAKKPWTRKRRPIGRRGGRY